MDDKWLKRRLSEVDKSEEIDPQDKSTEGPPAAPALESAAQVMIAYQNANKWLDIIKEELLMEIGCVFFSNYVHNLAHTMPVRFDNFGDILHTADIKVPYPATEYIPYEVMNIEEAFNAIFSILGSISESLREFIKVTQDTEKHGLACSTETLLNDIEGELPTLFRMRRAYLASDNDVLKFDKWIKQYVDNIASLLG